MAVKKTSKKKTTKKVEPKPVVNTAPAASNPYQGSDGKVYTRSQLRKGAAFRASVGIGELPPRP